jgi:hypothetical protein
MKTLLVAAVIFLVAPRTEAYNLIFHDVGVDWFGVADSANFGSFSALIGVCGNPLKCTYDFPIGGFGNPVSGLAVFEVLAGTHSCDSPIPHFI